MKNSVSLILLALAVSAHAQVTNTLEASNNGTIQSSGPRTGANGKNFLNIEGNGTGFASYGVADFDGALLAPSIANVTKISVILTESNAAFTAPGALRFFLSTDTTTSIDPGTSPLKYDATTLPSGIKPGDLATLVLLGTGNVTTTGNVNTGQVDTFTFNVSGQASSILSSALGHSAIRLVIAPDDATVAGTFAGFSHSTLNGPQIKLEGVPEPASMTVLGLGALALLRKRRSA